MTKRNIRTPIARPVAPEPTLRPLTERIAELIRQEIGGTVQVARFQLDLDTTDGTLYIDWERT